MIKTLKSNISSTLVSTKYDPEWTYIEIDTTNKGDTARCNTVIYTFYNYSYFDASTLFRKNNVVIDWGDGTVNSEGTHEFKANTGPNNRVVIKIKNMFNTMQYDTLSGGPTFSDFLDSNRTVGALSIGRNNLNKENYLTLDSLFRGCSVDHIDPHCFDFCQNILDFSHIFENTKISEIPENLFVNCKDADCFDYAFASCQNLKKFPVTIFDKCLHADSFYRTFKPDDTADLFDFLVDIVGVDELKGTWVSDFDQLNIAVDEFFGDRICKIRRTGKA